MTPTPTPLPPPGGPPAGWYPDPSGWGARYFDGHRWAPASAPPITPVGAPNAHPVLRFSDALVALAILAASLVVEKLVGAVLDDTGMPLLPLAGLSLAIAYGPSVWWCRQVVRREGSGWEAIGWRWRWVDLGWGPLLWIGAVIAQVIVVSVATRLGLPFESNVETGDGDRTAAYVIALIVSACLVAPLVEELIFRGVVLRGLVSRVGVVATVPIQGVLFGAAHVDPSRGWGNLGLALGLTSTGCALGLVAVLTRRLGAPILGHALLNGMVVTLLLTGVTDDLRRDLDALVASLC